MAGPIRISILANAAQARKELNGIAKTTSSLGGKLKKAGKIAGVGLLAVGAAAVKFGAASVKAASNAQQSLGATEQVFGKFAKTVIKRSEQAADAVGLSANEYRELANVTGAMLKNAGTPLKKVTDLTDDLTQRAADMAATFGGSTKDAISAVSSLLRGEVDPIEKYGVSIKQADVNARLAAKGLDNLEGSARKQAEQQARLDLLFEQSADSAGQFARESDTLAGKQQRLSAKIENLKVKVGNVLLPALTSVVGFISDSVIPTLEGWWDALAPAREAISKFAGGVGEIFGLIRDRDWSGAWDTLRTGTTNALTSVKEKAKNYITGTLAPAVANAVTRVREGWAEKWSKFWRDPDKAYDRTMSITREFSSDLGVEINRTMISIIADWARGWNGMPGVAARSANRTAAAVVQGLRGLPKLAGAIAVDVVGSLGQGLRALPDVGRGVIERTWTAIRSAAANAGTLLVGAGAAIIDGLISGITSRLDDLQGLLNSITDRIPDWKGPKAKDQRLLRPTGRWIMDGLIRGIEDGSHGVEKVLGRITKLIEKTVKGKNQAKREKAILKGLRDEYRALKKNARAQDKMNDRLKEARQRYRDLKQASKDYATSVKNSALAYASITNLDSAFNPSAIVAALRKRLEKLRQFAALITQLRAAGLNQTTLDQLIQGGVEGGLAYALAIQQGGQGAIAELNNLQVQIGQVAQDLGDTAASNMYDAGIAAAEGIVKGLEKAAAKIDRAAIRLANRLVAAVKKALGIKSPSKVFQGLGDDVIKGLRIGLDDTYVRRQGATLAASLQKGFGTPALDAYASSVAASREQRTITVKLTAQQVSQLQRGREIQLDLDAYHAAGGRRRA